MGDSSDRTPAEKIAAARATIEAEMRDIGARRVALLDETTALRRKIDDDSPHGVDLFLAAEELRIAIEADEMLLWRLTVLKGRLAEIDGHRPLRPLALLGYLAAFCGLTYMLALAVGLIAWLVGWASSPFSWFEQFR